MSWEAFINDNWNIIGRFPKDAAFLASGLSTPPSTAPDAPWTPRQPQHRHHRHPTPRSSRPTADGAYVRDVPKNSPPSDLCAAIWQVRHTRSMAGIQVLGSSARAPTLKPMADMVTAMTSSSTRRKDAAGSTSNKTILSTTPPRAWRSSSPWSASAGPAGVTRTGSQPTGQAAPPHGAPFCTTLMGMEASSCGCRQPRTCTSIGGGALNATSGSFDNDDIQFRARMVTGGAVLRADGIVATSGQGH